MTEDEYCAYMSCGVWYIHGNMDVCACACMCMCMQSCGRLISGQKPQRCSVTNQTLTVGEGGGQRGREGEEESGTT